MTQPCQQLLLTYCYQMMTQVFQRPLNPTLPHQPMATQMLTCKLQSHCQQHNATTCGHQSNLVALRIPVAALGPTCQ